MKASSQRPSYRAGIFLVNGFAVLTGGAAALLVLHCGTGPQSTLDADPPRARAKSEAKQVTIYDADPAHLWNRLHSALFVRTASDGKIYGQDELDPLLWPKSKFLLAGEHHQRVVALLDEFLAKDGHKFIKDPLKRVVFQHDLWAIFDWLANPNAVYNYRHDDFTPEARALQIRLAKTIRRLALSAEQIQQLPDNYAAAITAKAFSTSHNPEKPERAFLPADLFQPEGPWVLLGEHMRSVAPVHIRFVHGRSAFFVFLNLPAGRKATLAYLEKLGAFPDALMPQPADRHSKFMAKNLPRFNPELPQFPVGTQVALVREMLTIGDKDKIRPTRLIESVQFRVYREIPTGDPAHPEGFDDREGKQDFYEFRITRKDLFSGTTGGLHAVGPREEEINLFIPPAPDDRFEEDPPIPPGTSRIMAVCAGCHRRPGIHSVEAYRRSFIHLPRPPLLEKYDRGQQEQAAMRQKWENYSWGLLQGLMERE
jgi:hypothetical protein